MFGQWQYGVLIESPARNRVNLDARETGSAGILDTVKHARYRVVHVVDALESFIIKCIQTNRQALEPHTLKILCPA